MRSRYPLLCALLGMLPLACGDAGGDASSSNAAGSQAGASAPHPGSPAATSPASSGICSRCDGRCAEAVQLGAPLHLAEPIDYDDVPPAGGPHAACWGPYGVYDEPLSASRWVHNLEHGAVVYLYHCPEGCASEVAELEALVAVRERTILTPYPDMPPGFAAVAWGQRLVASCLDIEAMAEFYVAHWDRAPESVASGPPSGC